MAQGYETVTDPSVYVRFPLRGAVAGHSGVDLLIWTTTPWTLVSNTAVAVHPAVTYALARTEQGTFVVAEPLTRRVLGDEAEVLATVPGSDLEGLRYQRPFDLVDIPDAHRVVLAEYVTTEDGTGLVHQAPAFGADDLAVCRAYGLPLVNPVAPNGRFNDGIDLVGGVFFKDADALLIDRPEAVRSVVPARAVRAPLPALLAVPHAADVLRAAILVHPDHRGPRRADAGEREHQLVPGAHQTRPLRRLAEEQHRLGGVPRPVLGHPAAAVAMPGQPRDSCRFPCGARRAGRRRPVRAGSAPPVRRRDHLRLPGLRRRSPPGSPR